MKFRVGSFYSCDKHWGVFKCVARIRDEGLFRLIDEDKMKLHEEMKSSDDGTWTEVPTENVPHKYQVIEE